MKVERKQEFTPITITLETEFEARVLMTLVAVVAGKTKFKEVTDKLYDELDYLGISHFIGDNDTDFTFYSNNLTLPNIP